MKILFVCTGNTCRSPMAEGLFRKAAAEAGLAEQYPCASAGLSALDGAPASEYAVEACREIGVDLSGHRARRLRTEDLSGYDLYAVMGKTPAYILQAAGVPSDRIYLLGDPVADPYGGDLAEYRKCRDQLLEAVRRLLETLAGTDRGA